MNVGDRIPEILGIDQDGREMPAPCKHIRRSWQQPVMRLSA